MPSVAFQKFEKNMLDDVDRIIQSHKQLNHRGLGRRGLGHITRSGVLMLCAAWELYLEEIIVESVNVLIARATSPTSLPQAVQKEIAKHVKDSKHELKALELAGDGWKVTYHNHTTQSLVGFNTPKSVNVNRLFERFVGIADLSDDWSIGSSSLDKFVAVRGDIAHKGKDAGYITISNLNDYRSQIHRCVIDTDNTLANHLKKSTSGSAPWRRRQV